MRFSTIYNLRPESRSLGTVNNEPTMTQQSDAEDADINVMMEKYSHTGQFPGTIREPLYGDFTTVTDFRTALEMVRAAETAFDDVPAKVRARFNNDPAQFMAFINDPDNKEEMVKLGLTKPAETPIIIPEPPAPPTDKKDDK